MGYWTKVVIGICALGYSAAGWPRVDGQLAYEHLPGVIIPASLTATATTSNILSVRMIPDTIVHDAESDPRPAIAANWSDYPGLGRNL